MLFRKSVTEAVKDLIQAVEKRDEARYGKALGAIATAVPKASPDEVQAGIRDLMPVLETIPLGVGADLAQLVGAMSAHGTDPLAALPILASRAATAMELAQRFGSLYEEHIGEPPDSEDEAQFPATLERFATAAGLPARESHELTEAWFAGGHWVQPVLFLCQRKDVRLALPERDRLTAAIEATRESIGTAHWLYGLLMVIDDAPITVLHRATGMGYEITISGIGDNFQLHTLLAAHLIGPDGLPGERPSPAEIGAATTADLTPPKGIRGNFNLVDAYGAWIWNEGRPADIPLLDGERIIVLDPPPYGRSWNAGRAYPLMEPEFTVRRKLSAEEAAGWLSRVKPDERG